MKPSSAPLRWSLNKVAEEATISRQTVKNRMTRAGIEPGEDGMYSTAQVLAALYGNTEGEKLKKLAAEREKAELEVGKLRGEFVSSREVERFWSHTVSECRAAWLQLPAKAAVAFPTWPDARACESWVMASVREILTELATDKKYAPDGEQKAEGGGDVESD